MSMQVVNKLGPIVPTFFSPNQSSFFEIIFVAFISSSIWQKCLPCAKGVAENMQ
jgi:hypothetical protein